MPKKSAPGVIPKVRDFDYYTLTDAARAFECSPATIRNRFDRGELAGVKASDGTRLINRADVERSK